MWLAVQTLSLQIRQDPNHLTPVETAQLRNARPTPFITPKGVKTKPANLQKEAEESAQCISAGGYKWGPLHSNPSLPKRQFCNMDRHSMLPHENWGSLWVLAFSQKMVHGCKTEKGMRKHSSMEKRGKIYSWIRKQQFILKIHMEAGKNSLHLKNHRQILK